MHALGSVWTPRRYSYRHGAQSRMPSAGTSTSPGRLATVFFGAINFDSEFLARPEEWDLLGIDADQLSGLGIASLARATLLDRETAEAADFDPLAPRQRVGHRVEHRIDDGLRLAMSKLAAARQQLFDDFPLGHRSPRRAPPAWLPAAPRLAVLAAANRAALAVVAIELELFLQDIFHREARRLVLALEVRLHFLALFVLLDRLDQI